MPVPVAVALSSTSARRAVERISRANCGAAAKGPAVLPCKRCASTLPPGACWPAASRRRAASAMCALKSRVRACEQGELLHKRGAHWAAPLYRRGVRGGGARRGLLWARRARGKEGAHEHEEAANCGWSSCFATVTTCARRSGARQAPRLRFVCGNAEDLATFLAGAQRTEPNRRAPSLVPFPFPCPHSPSCCCETGVKGCCAVPCLCGARCCVLRKAGVALQRDRARADFVHHGISARLLTFTPLWYVKEERKREQASKQTRRARKSCDASRILLAATALPPGIDTSHLRRPTCLSCAHSR